MKEGVSMMSYEGNKNEKFQMNECDFLELFLAQNIDNMSVTLYLQSIGRIH